MSLPPSTPPASPEQLQRLASGIGAAARRGPAPVERWNPPYCGDIGLAIAADGTWHYRSSLIARPALVGLFASALRRDEDGRHYLVTPVEKIAVAVADAPFLAVEMRTEGSGGSQRIALRTNLDEWIEAGPDHPLRFVEEPPEGALKPYLLVRGRLEARLTRALVYDLIDQAVVEPVEGSDMIGVWSGGAFFAIAPAATRGRS